jgi:outer membrane protein assembly factor BamA
MFPAIEDKGVSLNRVLLALILSCVAAQAIAEVELPERRKDQFPTDSGYYLVPSPYSIPGLGSGFILIGAMTNVKHSHADMYGFAATGDIQGYGLFATEIHLLEKKLILDLTATSFNKATSQVYRQRGMRTSADDYILAELDRNDFTGARLTWTLFDRRLEFYGLVYNNKTRLAAIRDRDGNLIQSTIDSELARSKSYSYGARIDLTDDYVDPRRGMRVESSLWYSPPDNNDSPDFDIIELNLTGYVPIGKRDTIALNYFQADTHIRRTGQTAPSLVESSLGLDCAAGSLQDQADCRSIVDDRVAENTYGSVGSMGGLSRLRSFPEDRFKGSHAKFIGIEYRWNLVEETRPFDYFFAKDIRTVIQFAAFYERGAISDDKGELWSTMRESYGVGARLITKSGLVFRADIATGDEGREVSIIFGYPWEVF